MVTALLLENYQIKLLKKISCILLVLCTLFNSFSIQLEAHPVNKIESRVNSSGSQKAAVSNVALRMNISAPVRSSDSAKISKNVASLVD